MTDNRTRARTAVSCAICQKPINPSSRASLTAWIFRESRCRCAVPEAKFEHEEESFESEPEPVDFPQSIAERFEVTSRIGVGGMGTIYKVSDKSNNRICALKVLRPELTRSNATKRRFLNEAKVASSLSHPNIIQILDYGVIDEDTPYLVMEYLDGQTLSQILANESIISEARVLQLFIQIAEALAYAHLKGVTHRDVKPSNIIVLKDESGVERPTIVDFGIAKFSDGRTTATITQTGQVFGSPYYMSPEQCRGEAVDPRSDIYSLGCVLHECLSGRPPFCSDSAVKTMIDHLTESPPKLTDRNPQLSKQIEKLVLTCLEKRKTKRYQTMSDVMRDLKNLRDGQPLQFGSKTRLRLPSRKFQVAGAALLLLILVKETNLQYHWIRWNMERDIAQLQKPITGIELTDSYIWLWADYPQNDPHKTMSPAQEKALEILKKRINSTRDPAQRATALMQLSLALEEKKRQSGGTPGPELLFSGASEYARQAVALMKASTKFSQKDILKARFIHAQILFRETMPTNGMYDLLSKNLATTEEPGRALLNQLSAIEEELKRSDSNSSRSPPLLDDVLLLEGNVFFFLREFEHASEKYETAFAMDDGNMPPSHGFTPIDPLDAEPTDRFTVPETWVSSEDFALAQARCGDCYRSDKQLSRAIAAYRNAVKYWENNKHDDRNLALASAFLESLEGDQTHNFSPDQWHLIIERAEKAFPLPPSDLAGSGLKNRYTTDDLRYFQGLLLVLILDSCVKHMAMFDYDEAKQLRAKVTKLYEGT